MTDNRKMYFLNTLISQNHPYHLVVQEGRRVGICTKCTYGGNISNSLGLGILFKHWSRWMNIDRAMDTDSQKRNMGLEVE